ncbi:MAG: protoporphyrinogen oxidase [Desulfovibrio sp.]|jgi:hypothetical protein|nr:protoporphyrinogen oxidase [Desulfovibrio sp.]
MTRFAISLLLLISLAWPASAQTKTFAHFSAKLPDGWDGEENSGFTSKRSNEYMLVFKIHDAEGENIKGVVSVFLLPPLLGGIEGVAKKLAAMQENSTVPHPEEGSDGHFWIFGGEPRTQGFKAPAVTRVNVTPDHVLIVIVQDPEHFGGDKLFDNLRGVTPEAKEALGR